MEAPGARVLSIEGGGAPVLASALVLADFERRSEKRIYELFDFVAATDFGALLALMLTSSWAESDDEPLSASDAAHILRTELPRVLTRPVWSRIRRLRGSDQAKYQTDLLRRFAGDMFGPRRLADARTEVLIPTYDLARNEPYLMTRAKARLTQDHNWALVDVASAGAAVPTLFKPYRLDGMFLTSGSLSEPNPARLAVAAMLASATPILAADMLVVSVASPRSDEHRQGARRPSTLEFLDVAARGSADSADYLLQRLLNGVRAPTTADQQFRGPRYYRLGTVTDRRLRLFDDHVSAADMAAIESAAHTVVTERAAEIDQLIERLVSRPATPLQTPAPADPVTAPQRKAVDPSDRVVEEALPDRGTSPPPTRMPEVTPHRPLIDPGW